MRPTVAEQLRAVRRLIDEAQADPGLADASRQALALASGQLRRLEGSCEQRLPFLVQDNVECAALLDELAVLVPALRPPAAPAPGPEYVASERDAEARNTELRALLARAVAELPDGPAGDDGRVRIAARLRRRIGLDPALNRPSRPTTGN